MAALHLNHEEKVLEVVRDHWVILGRPFLVYAAGWAVIILFYYASPYFGPLTQSLLLFLNLLILWGIHHWFFIYLFHRELSGLVITNQRLIDFHYLPFVRKDIIYVSIKEIREMEDNQEGLLRNILNYGDLKVILEGNETIHFTYTPKPSRVLNVIETLSKNF